MKLCLDTTPVTLQPSGVGLYILNLIEELTRRSSTNNIELFLSYQPTFSNWIRKMWRFPPQLQQYEHKQILPVPVRLSNLFLRDTTGLAGRVLTSYLGQPDILHGTNYSVYPLSCGYRVMTIYDVSFSLYPEYATSVSKSYCQLVSRCLQWTDLILTISHSSKRDIVDCFKVPEEKIWVTPLASRYAVVESSSEELADSKVKLLELSCQSSFSIDFNRPYILFVGTLEPRKNIELIVQSFNQLKSRYKIDHQLLLVGRKGWFYEPILAAINQSPYRDSIHHLDYVSDQFMGHLYKNATVFAYPSHYEGFGLPVLEAMGFGCPVVSSVTSSIPEVAGDAAILISPDDADALAAAIYQLLDSPSLRRHYVQAGYEQAKKFSWQKTAQSTIEAYHSLMS